MDSRGGTRNSNSGAGASVATNGNYVGRLLNEVEAAELLGGFSVKTLQRWRWQGGGPDFLKLNNAAVRYEWEALMAFIAAGRRRSTSDTEAT